MGEDLAFREGQRSGQGFRSGWNGAGVYQVAQSVRV